MKKNFIILLLAYSLFFCSFTLSKKSEQSKEIKKLLKRYKKADSDNKLPFILDFPHYEDTPVVKIRLDNQFFFMLVDTGGGSNRLYTNGISKIEKYISVDTQKVVLCGITFTLDKSNIYHEDSDICDGVLGIPYLKQFDIVTFDYINQEIILNDSELKNGNPLFVRKKHFYCNFVVDKKEYEGFIDTGSDCCVFNESFFDNNNYDDGVVNCIIEELSLSNIKYDNLYVFRSSNPVLKVNEPSRAFMLANNLLGAPLFLNHILKIDFKNMQFEVL